MKTELLISELESIRGIIAGYADREENHFSKNVHHHHVGDLFTAIQTLQSYKTSIDELRDETEQASPDGWVKVDDVSDLLVLNGTNHFLIHVINSNTKTEYWDIVTGYISESGDLMHACGDDESGWQYMDVVYYKPVGILPPLPKKDKP